MYTWNAVWVFHRATKNQFWIYDAGRAGGWMQNCTGSTSTRGSVEGDVLRVRIHNDGVDAAPDGASNDEGRCKDGVSWTDETFFDASTGKAIAAVRWIDKSRATIRVESRSISVSGGGCNERLSF
jgi:hypothetical protein